MLNYKTRTYGKTKAIPYDELKEGFETSALDYVQLAVLFGSRAYGMENAKSDYDFAVLLEENSNEAWGMMAKLYADVHEIFGLKESDYDIVDLSRANSSILYTIKEKYVLLKGSENELSKIFR